MLFLERMYGEDAPTAGWQAVEGFVAASLGACGALALFPEHTGMISIFLCAMASLPTIERQLLWNHRNIVDLGRPPSEVNAEFTLRVMAMFGGQLVAFSVLAMALEPESLRTAFALQLSSYGEMSAPTLAFPSFLAVLGHNLQVLCLFFALGFVFRQGGALLAVAWNASVWGVVFGWLARSWAADGGPPVAEAYGRVMAVVLPHMLAEACGYVLIGFAGVFLSQAVSRYAPHRDWANLARSLTLMMTTATILVAAGALWEGRVAPRLVELLLR